MFLERISDPFLRRQFELLYDQLDSRVTAKKEAFVQLEELGKAYSEIQVFQDIPGVGPKGALLFDAMIQTPHRFAKRQSLWRYCKLGVVSRASNGKQIGRRFLDRSGHGILKDVSNRAFRAALNKNDNNEVIQHYELSLLRTHNPVHARLGTQRKILTTMWVLWKNNTTYKPHMFFPIPTQGG
jgi:transposase